MRLVSFASECLFLRLCFPRKAGTFSGSWRSHQIKVSWESACPRGKMSSWSSFTAISSSGRPSRKRPRAPLKLHEVWKKTNLPVKAEHMIRRTIRNLHNEYVYFKKEAKAGDTCRHDKDGGWKGDRQDVFDITCGKILEANVTEVDLAFLELQRKDRQSCSMGGGVSINSMHPLSPRRLKE